MEAGRPENTLPGKGVADELKMLEQNPEEHDRIVHELIQKSLSDAAGDSVLKRQTLRSFGIKKLFFQSCCACAVEVHPTFSYTVTCRCN